MKRDCRQHHPAPRTASLRRTCSVCGNIVAVVSDARRQTARHSQTQRHTATHNDTHTHARARAYRHHCTTSHRIQQSKPYLLDHGKATKPTASHRAATSLRGRRISAHSTDMVAQLQPIVRQLRVREGERFGERMLCCPSTHRTPPCHAPCTNTPHHTTPRHTTPHHTTATCGTWTTCTHRSPLVQPKQCLPTRRYQAQPRTASDPCHPQLRRCTRTHQPVANHLGRMERSLEGRTWPSLQHNAFSRAMKLAEQNNTAADRDCRRPNGTVSLIRSLSRGCCKACVGERASACPMVVPPATGTLA